MNFHRARALCILYPSGYLGWKRKKWLSPLGNKMWRLSIQSIPPDPLSAHSDIKKHNLIRSPRADHNSATEFSAVSIRLLAGLRLLSGRSGIGPAKVGSIAAEAFTLARRTATSKGDHWHSNRPAAKWAASRLVRSPEVNPARDFRWGMCDLQDRHLCGNPGT